MHRLPFSTLHLSLVYLCLIAVGLSACSLVSPTAPPTAADLPQPVTLLSSPTAALLPTLAASATQLPPTSTNLPPTETTLPSTNTPPPTAEPPTAVPMFQSSGTFAVVRVKRNEKLALYQDAGIYSTLLGELPYDATGNRLTGNTVDINGERWVQITIPGSVTGWVNSLYLAEQVSPAAFCADERIPVLLSDLGRAYTTQDGELYARLVSPAHGLDLIYLHTGRIANYSPEEARFVFTSSYQMNWGMHPASALEVVGSFHEEVLPRLVETFTSQYQLYCNDVGPGAGNYAMAWPAEYQNINFYAVFKPGTPGVDLDWRSWLIGIEYIDSQPYLFSMIQYFWEP